jgi:hypothetical protein
MVKTIELRRVDRWLIFDGDHWPERARFTREDLTELEPQVQEHGLCVDVATLNGRAIYRLDRLADGIAEGKLVYHEGPP